MTFAKIIHIKKAFSVVSKETLTCRHDAPKHVHIMHTASQRRVQFDSPVAADEMASSTSESDDEATIRPESSAAI